MKLLTSVVLISSILTVTGCQSTQEKPTKYNTVDVSSVDQSLMRSAELAQRSLAILEQNSNYLTTRALTDAQRDAIRTQAAYIPPGLEQPVTFNQRLPITKTVTLIAEMTGYKVQRVNPPAVDVSETVTAYARPAVDVLRDLGTRLGSRATIKIIPNQHIGKNDLNGVIQIIYPNPIDERG